VRGVVLCLLLLGCEPDFSNTSFQCDDQHGCPEHQNCIAGRCRRGSTTGDGVVCDTATCDITQQCCLDNFNPPRCIPAGDVCEGTSALCDGVEDCDPGDHCCSATLTTCGASCMTTACRTAVDCPSEEPNCCAVMDQPWSECSTFPCS
jgi:hypothetical protein